MCREVCRRVEPDTCAQFLRGRRAQSYVSYSTLRVHLGRVPGASRLETYRTLDVHALVQEPVSGVDLDEAARSRGRAVARDEDLFRTVAPPVATWRATQSGDRDQAGEASLSEAALLVRPAGRRQHGPFAYVLGVIVVDSRVEIKTSFLPDPYLIVHPSQPARPPDLTSPAPRPAGTPSHRSPAGPVDPRRRAQHQGAQNR